MPHDAAAAELVGSGDAPGSVLGAVADIQHHGRIEISQVGGHDQPRGGLWQAFDAGDVAGDIVDADADQVVPHVLGLLLVRGQEYQRVLVRFRVHRPGAVAGHGLAGGDVQGAGDCAFMDFAVGAGVDEGDLVAGEIPGDVGGVQFHERSAFAHDGRALAVFALHPAEVGVGVGLAVEEFVDEALLVVCCEVGTPPGVEPLVTDGGGGDGAEGLAAGAARAVTGMDLDVVGKGQELVPQAGEELRGAFEAGIDSAGCLIEQVRPAQVTGEDEVAGEQVAGMVAERTVGDQERQVFRCVPGGVDGLDADIAESELVAVVEPFAVELVLPVRASFTRYVNRGPGRGGQLAGAGEVVGVNVGFGNGHDLHAVPFGEILVDGNVAAAVDNNRFTLGLAADQVAGLGEVFVVNALDKHLVLSFVKGVGRGFFPWF